MAISNQCMQSMQISQIQSHSQSQSLSQNIGEDFIDFVAKAACHDNDGVYHHVMYDLLVYAILNNLTFMLNVDVFIPHIILVHVPLHVPKQARVIHNRVYEFDDVYQLVDGMIDLFDQVATSIPSLLQYQRWKRDLMVFRKRAHHLLPLCDEMESLIKDMECL